MSTDPSQDEVLWHFRQKAPEMSLPLIMLPEGLERELLNRLTAMQTVLQLNPRATGLDLLGSVQPELGRHYQAVYETLPLVSNKPQQNTLRRFVTATPKLYHTDASGRLKTTVAGPMAVSQSMRLPTEMDEALVKEIYAGKRLSPSQARAGFAVWQKQRLPEILKGLKQIDQDEKAIQARAQAKAQFQQLPLRHKMLVIAENVLPRLNTIPAETQVFILTAMAGTPWHALPLSGFQAVLTDNLLIPLLKGAGDHLITLDISGCQRLSSGILPSITEYCPKLKCLLVNDQREWKNIDTHNLLELSRLEIDGAAQLTQLILGNLPLLTHLSLAGAVQLKTIGDRGLRISTNTQAWRLPRLQNLNTRDCSTLRTVYVEPDSVDNLQWDFEGCTALERPVLLANMVRNPDLLTPILDAKDDFTICPHITRLEVRADGGRGQVQYYQEQPAFTAAGVPFSEVNAASGEVYQRLEAKSTNRDDFVLVPEGAERERIIKILRTAPDRGYGLYAEIDGQRISLRGGSSPSLALYTHHETRELWIGKSELLDAGARESRLELLDAPGRGVTKNALLKEIVAYDIFAYYGVSVPRLSIASAQARYKNAEMQWAYDERQAWHWHIFSRWLDKFRIYGYMPKFTASDSYFSLVTDDRQIRERGLGNILAVAHFINDVDAMNSGGNNVGYQLKTDAQGELYAQSYKIDPAWSFTGCQEKKLETQPTRAIRVSCDSIVLYDDLPKATQAEFIQTLALISETPDKDIERFFNRGAGLTFTHIPEPGNPNGPMFVNSAIAMLKARRNVLRQLFIEELQAAKVANTAQKPLSKSVVELPPELAPIYAQMQFEQADPIVQQARYFYIPANITRNGDKTEATEPLQAIMDEFLSNATQRTLLLLGDAGFGKSTITQIFYQQYWKRYLTNLSQLTSPLNSVPRSKTGLRKNLASLFRKTRVNSPVSAEVQKTNSSEHSAGSTTSSPLLEEAQEKNRIVLRIELKQFSQRTVLHCVDNTLKDTYHLTEHQIKDLKNYPCLIILDGFDEMAGRLKCNLWQSNQLQTWRDVKLLITCHSVYLEQSDLPLCFYPSSQQAQAFTKCYLAPFTPIQIKVYLEKILQAKSSSEGLEIKQSEPDPRCAALLASQAANSSTLQGLLEVPLMLKIFTDVLPALERQGNNLTELNRYSLYEAFMRQWFNRHKDRLSQHLGQAIDEGICQRFLTYSQDLAFELFKANCLELDYAPGQAPWDRFFSQSDTESIHLRSSCPLHRTGNRYSFICKSFLEFFVAQSILDYCKDPQSFATLTVALSHRTLTDESQIILFLQEAYQAAKTPLAFVACLEAVIFASIQQPDIAIASSNAVTLLNACGINLTQRKIQIIAPHPKELCLAIGQENKIVLMHRDTREVTGQRMVGHTDKVSSVAFSPDGSSVVSGSHDQTLRLWDTQTQKAIGQPMVGHTSPVEGVAFSSEGATVVSGSQDKTVRLWNVTQIMTMRHTDGIILLRWHQSILSLSFAPCSLKKAVNAILAKEKSSHVSSEHSNDRFVSEMEDILVMGDGAGAISFWAVSRGLNPQARFLGMPKHFSMPLLPIGTHSLRNSSRSSYTSSTSPVVNTGFFSTTTSSATSHTAYSGSLSPSAAPFNEVKTITPIPVIIEQKAESQNPQTKFEAVKELLNDVYPSDAPEHASQRAQWLTKLSPYQERSELLTSADQELLTQLEQDLLEEMQALLTVRAEMN